MTTACGRAGEEPRRTMIPFAKTEALGNDLILVAEGQSGPQDWPQVARAMCARRLGVGADGLLVLASGATNPWRMRMFNPDGSEDMCGNGLRCVGAYLQRRGLLGPEGTALETIAGTRAIRPVSDGVVEAELGVPSLRPSDLPMNLTAATAVDYALKLAGERVTLTGLSTGTPHAVIITDTPVENETFLRVSPALEVHELFPARTSVTWVSVDSRESIRARFWERAVGESLSCGTGAAAAMVAARLHGLVDDSVEVRMAGGALRVTWSGRGSLLQIGPAREVFEGWWPVSAMAGSGPAAG